MKKYLYFIAGIIILSPIIISIGLDGSIIFDRIARKGEFIISLPVSIFFSLLVVLTNLRRSISNKYIVLLASYFLICILMNFFVNNGENFLSLLLIELQIFQFILVMYAFQYYFQKRIIDVDLAERRFIIYPFVVVVAVVLISGLVYEFGIFVSESIVMYGFRQYYAFFTVLLLGIIARFGLMYVLLFWLISLYVSQVTDNETALIVNVLFLFIYLIDYLMNKNKILFHKMVSIILITTFIFAPLIILLVHYFVPFSGPGGMYVRAGSVNNYFSEVIIEWYSVFVPFLNNDIHTYWHNQLLVIFSSSGIIGVVLYYLIFIKNTNYINKYRMVRVALFLVVFIGGITVLPTMNLYLSITIAYITSFYYVASIRSQNYKSFSS